MKLNVLNKIAWAFHTHLAENELCLQTLCVTFIVHRKEEVFIFTVHGKGELIPHNSFFFKQCFVIANVLAMINPSIHTYSGPSTMLLKNSKYLNIVMSFWFSFHI